MKCLNEYVIASDSSFTLIHKALKYYSLYKTGFNFTSRQVSKSTDKNALAAHLETIFAATSNFISNSKPSAKKADPHSPESLREQPNTNQENTRTSQNSWVSRDRSPGPKGSKNYEVSPLKLSNQSIPLSPISRSHDNHVALLFTRWG